jgi:flagellar protein FliS
MAGFSAKTYTKTGVEMDVLNADPHRLIVILFDGAIGTIQRAKGFMAQKKTAEKCDAIDQAMRIIDCGLCASVDPSHAPQFAARLVGLYRYMLRRLVLANSRNDAKILDEVTGLLGGLRDAWAKIGAGAAVQPVAVQAALEPVVQRANMTYAARALHAYRA